MSLTEKIVDRMYRYNYERDGIGIQQDFENKQDMTILEKKYSEEVDRQLKEKKAA